ncbi:hypothetical protein SDC9_171656 [bioreactor metagenome]|uniref:Nucleotidyl transferase domain-containing protein n=1 Tax=bioreactor metagenome TaxID=1076179 RepID=A0A645GBI9_9ZZZZ
MNDLPDGYQMPAERVKPWGTTHAILACRQQLTEPFMVINADDYYGKQAFKTMYDFLCRDVKDDEYGMVGYVVSNTLTDYGTVMRGVCDVENGYLNKLIERKSIKKEQGMPYYSEDGHNWIAIPQDNLVSMNFWGFTPKIMDYLMPIFSDFLKNNLHDNPLKCEHVIPTAVDELIHRHGIKVRVMRSDDTWYGITYKEDKIRIMESLAELKARQAYPADLWKK